MKILGREPTVILQSLSALLSILVTFQLDWFRPEHEPLVVAFIGAVLGLINAYAVRPWKPSAFIGFVTAGAALVTGYGIDLDPKLVASITAAIPVLLALQLRGQVTPAADPRPAEQVVG